MDHNHVPFVVILVKLCAQWRNSHDGAMPKNQKEKQEFTASLKEQIRFTTQTNFDEAKNVILDCFKTEEIPFEITKILENCSCDRIVHDDFWLFMAALKKFIA